MIHATTIYDHLSMSTSWLNHLCWRRGLHGLGRHGLRLLAMGWGRRVLTWMLWNYFIVFLTRVIFVHGTSWYDCTFHIWTGNLILCFKIHDIRLGNSIIENRQYWSTFHLVSSDTNLKLIIKLCWAPQKNYFGQVRFKLRETQRASSFSAAGLAHELQFRWVMSRMR